MRSNGEIVITDASIEDVERFIENAGKSLSQFRYYSNRPFSVIDNHLKTICAFEENIPIGYGHLDPDGVNVWLGICVAEKFIGLGIGKKLMSGLIHSARNLDIGELTLTVDKDNLGAIALYKSFGFIVTSESADIQFMTLSI